MLEILLVLVALTVFLLFTGIVMPSRGARDKQPPEMVAALGRAAGNKGKMLASVASQGARRAMRQDPLNARYLRQLKQANWYWEPGEPIMPNAKAPFWNLETLWSQKMFGLLVYGGVAMGVVAVIGVVLSLAAQVPLIAVLLIAAVAGGVVGFMSFNSPDGALVDAAVKRQRELALEMGFRIPELRADVMAGNTVQRAIRNMSRRPGGAFVEELRRAVAVLDVTKDDTLAMDQLIERNGNNELLIEFANSLKMVSRQGGQIGPVLNVLADLAQQRLRLTIQAQARKNLQEMTRPTGLSSMMVTSLLIIAPALAGVMSSIAR
jgi:hypothetical protein